MTDLTTIGTCGDDNNTDNLQDRYTAMCQLRAGREVEAAGHDLRGAGLRKARLTRGDLIRADLIGADLTDAQR